MTYDDFIQSLQYCQSKSGMSKAIDFPIVFDCHEDGLIYMNSSGEVFFSDRYARWHKTIYNVTSVSGVRFKTVNLGNTNMTIGDEPDESYVYIHFSNGDVIHIVSQNYYSAGIDVTLLTRSDRELSETDASIITLIEAGEIRMKRGLS